MAQLRVDFVAIDVETANPDVASICQVGVAGYEAGQLVSEWATYVDPVARFASRNVAVHGIDKAMVTGAPTFAKVAPDLLPQLQGNVVVSHSAFDRRALEKAFGAHALDMPELTWLDSALVARRAWEQCRDRGYGLADVCRIIDYDFKHHDALEDAKAVGRVLLAAMEVTGLSLDQWLDRLATPQGVTFAAPGASASSRHRKYPSSVVLDGDPEGPLCGEVVVFTGELSISRNEAAQLAASVGCRVAAGVSKKVTLLVVGDQSAADSADGQVKTTKLRKAEELSAMGHPIRIIYESDFKEMLLLDCPELEWWDKRPLG